MWLMDETCKICTARNRYYTFFFFLFVIIFAGICHINLQIHWIFRLFIFIFPNYSSVSSAHSTGCTKYLNLFIQSQRQFEQCAMKYAVPVTMCENCVEPYVETVQTFYTLTTTPVPNDVRHKCIDQFINHNTLNIIWNQYQNSRNLWNDAACTSKFFV